MTSRIRTVSLLAASALVIATVRCGGGGGGGGGVSGGGDNQQAAFNFNEANMTYAAGAASIAIDAFAPLSDGVDATLALLWQPGAVQSGQPTPLALCASGTAGVAWTDASGDGAFSAGDTAIISLRSCRMHSGDAEVLTGDVSLTFTSVSRGPPRAATLVLESALGVYGGAVDGWIGGRAEVEATPRGSRHELHFQTAGTSRMSVTGSAPLDLGCFEVLHWYDPALGFARQIAIDGSVRTLGKVMSFSPGRAKLLYRADDQPGDGEVVLLSFMNQPNCPALGISDGVSDSDRSTLTITPGVTAGEMHLEVQRPGLPACSDSCSWSDLLHPAEPHHGIIGGTNVVSVASATVSALALPRDVGALATDLVLGVYRGSPVPLCTSGGYSVSPTPTLAVGQAVTVTFTGCATTLLGPQVTLSGRTALTVTVVSGQPSGSSYVLASDVGPLEVTTSGSGESSRVTGSFRFERTAAGADVSERSEAIAGSALSIAETMGSTTTERHLTAFSIASATTATGFTIASAGDLATIGTGAFAGNLTVSVTGAVHGAGQAAPDSGGMKIAATDSTSVTLTVGAGGAVDLGLDEDGNGTVDATIHTLWTELR
jgi:hypothetical protein